MKKIYSFNLSKDNFVEEPVLKKDESGAEIKVLEKVNKPIVKTYFFAKPSFSIKQESNLYYESIVAECIKRGIFSTIQLRKRFVDDGGLLSKEEKKNHEKLWEDLWSKKAELNELTKATEQDRDKVKIANDEILKILGELQSLEEKSGSSLLYQHTAETIAADRVQIWLMLNLSYQDLGNNKYEPVFGKGNLEEKLNKYEELESGEDKYDFELAQKLLLITNLWFYGKAEKQEDFDILLKMAEGKNLFSK
jgi:hypothetical protein